MFLSICKARKKEKKHSWIGIEIGECTSILGVKSYEIRIHRIKKLMTVTEVGGFI